MRNYLSHQLRGDKFNNLRPGHLSLSPNPHEFYKDYLITKNYKVGLPINTNRIKSYAKRNKRISLIGLKKEIFLFISF